MANCEKYKNLPELERTKLGKLISKRMCGKSHIAGVSIFNSDLLEYAFYIEVYKYNSSGTKGWSTNGYARKKKNGDWTINMNPVKGAKQHIGRSPKYC